MPWVGLYIAAASALCILALAADAFNSFRRKKLWFPCKYTALNATSLTVLAVAMKLPMDLNTIMINSETDSIAKFTSLPLMSAALNNLMPSLGSMNDKELLANATGLSILVITITVNMVIQVIELQQSLVHVMILCAAMLVSLTMLVSLAVSVSEMKRRLKRLYQEKHGELVLQGFEMEDQRREMMKYWVMAESSCP